MKSGEIATIFVDFYKNRGFEVLPQAPLMDSSIPMSFVMSAGLVQIERSLSKLRIEKRDKYVLVQNCFRHFDIEKVGTDGIHLSFFSMPGAFVFGDICPEATIQAMWILATNILKLNPDKLWATYFFGGEVLGKIQPKDTQSYLSWVKVGLPDERIVGLGSQQNFWIQGSGFQLDYQLKKCGPHTELFFDQGKQIKCGTDCKPGCRCGRFVEFSNSLFIRFEIENNKLKNIDIPFTETVIGTERVEMLQSNFDSVFETSTYSSIIRTIGKFLINDISHEDVKASSGIIADHLWALYCLVKDGAPPPGKDGRRRIIKILIRRIITQQFILGIKSDEFIPAVLESVIHQSSADQYFLRDTYAKIITYVQSEDHRYRKTLQRGFKQIMRLITQNAGQTLTPIQIQELRKYWGIPEALTRKILQADLLANGNFLESIHSRFVL